MDRLVLFSVLLIASVSAFVGVQTGYHEAFGIPTARKIRAYEEELLKNETKFQRIIGGYLASEYSHPYFAGLLISLVGVAGNSVCGSSLLTANRLVTAAHCWWDGVKQPSHMLVILGSNFLYSGGIRITTNKVIVHPRWNMAALINDVAMVYLSTNVQFSASIHPIELPNSFELGSSFEGMWAVATGFGATYDRQQGSSTVLSQVKLQVMSNHHCKAFFGYGVYGSTICTSGAGGVGICYGDSGGPLALKLNGGTVLIGVSSFVAGGNNCERGFPSAFSRVTSHVNFINQHL